MTSYDIINCALATKTTMLIKLLFQKFIVYIMNNLCAKFGCHISSNSKDKQGGGAESAPPQALSVSNHPGQIGLKIGITLVIIKLLGNIPDTKDSLMRRERSLGIRTSRIKNL